MSSQPPPPRASRAVAAGLTLATLLATAALVAAMVPGGPAWFGPPWWGSAGAVAVSTVYTVALAARTGGRPVVFGALALALGLAAVLLDDDRLRTGAAVTTCAIAAVLGVMTTVPAPRFRHAVRECLVAMTIAAVGGLAVLGYAPVIAVARFEYVAFGLALAGAFVLVYRLGAGLHGLGRRGVLVVVVGAAVLTVTLLYAELLRRYGTQDLVESLLDGVRWSREELGAFPRPIESVLGVPALIWGCHMRARRRQGWWVCAFGVAATAAAASSLVNPAITLTEAVLSVVYGIVVGIVIGFLVVRLDLALTGPRGRRTRARAGDADVAVRPEPPRGAALL